jgi:hypothetical protein
VGLSLYLCQHCFLVGVGRGGAIQGRARPLGVVELHPPVDDALGLEAGGEFVQADGLVLEQAPEALDEDVVHNRPLPSMKMATPAFLCMSVNSRLVDWLPWSVLKISGRP